MQSKSRIEQLKLARRLLSGEQLPSEPRFWIVVNGTPQDQAYFTDLKISDVQINLNTIKK
jgi:hypothetical protein